ncbi:uncharacterized protein LOC141852364 isoform X2 [Brevipalpus obovatus]|uniref:uncharacterized protein LOC141852364 isoform X2 n=1 Tax=Brevipalpus obovatus TaxID=246614 RepID=UPI003D9EA72C
MNCAQGSQRYQQKRIVSFFAMVSIKFFGPSILFSAIALQYIQADPAVTSKAELRKAMIMYNLQTDSLKAKLQDKIESCRSHREDQATEELEKAMGLLVSRQSRMNQVFGKSFSTAVQDQLLQGANKIIILVKNIMRTTGC